MKTNQIGNKTFNLSDCNEGGIRGFKWTKEGTRGYTRGHKRGFQEGGGKKSRLYVNESVATKGHKWYKEVQRRCKWVVGKS